MKKILSLMLFSLAFTAIAETKIDECQKTETFIENSQFKIEQTNFTPETILILLVEKI